MTSRAAAPAGRWRAAPAAVLLACAAWHTAADPLPVTVTVHATAPTVDGTLEEWPAAGFVEIPVAPAIEGDDKNRTGSLSVALQARVSGDRLYLALRWPDPAESRDHRPWRSHGGKYRRSRTRDDMLAVRWHMSGDYDRSMLSDRTYSVDVWVWSAGRSDGTGIADDAVHVISSARLENAAEHVLPSGALVYIQKRFDEGTPGYQGRRADAAAGAAEQSSVELSGVASGSRADVTARGTWRDGHWHLELGRTLDTGHGDDVVFAPGAAILGQIAVFNEGYDGHKSVSEPLLFRFPRP